MPYRVPIVISTFDPGSKLYLEFEEKYHEEIEDFKSICGVRRNIF